MASIYVVFIRAETGLGKISRFLLDYEYTHIAVSFERNMEDFVTFSRRRHYAPFDAGFMHEKREHYAFGRYRAVKVKVYRVPISEKKKDKLQEFVSRIEADPDYVFNLYSMLTMPVFHGLSIEKTYNCMSFVGEILQLSGAVTMNRESFQYNIKELEQMLQKYPCKEGYLRKRKEDATYMERVGFLSNVKDFFQLNRILLGRIILSNKSYQEEKK